MYRRRKDRRILTLMVVLLTGCLFGEHAFSETPDYASLAKKTAKSVVLILAYDETGTMVAQGSGFVVDARGTIVTNVHVLEMAASAVVKFSDGAYYETAGLTAMDCNADLAVAKLKTTRTDFPHLRFADPKSVELGKSVFCIGNPLTSSIDAVSTENTLSTGIISGLRQWGDQKINVIQTTAPISSGNSGGPLMDDKGKVVGVMTFQISKGQNLNFAVALDHLLPLLEGDQARPIKNMMTLCHHTEGKKASPDTGSPETIAGTYSGTWKSDAYDISGAAIVKVNVEGEKVYAKAMLTGSPIGFKGDDLSGKAEKFADGVWVVNFKAKNSPLEIRAIFKDDGFVGDYRFDIGQSPDQGQWRLKR